MDKKDGEIYGTVLSPKERFGTMGLSSCYKVMLWPIVLPNILRFLHVSNLCNAMAIVASRCLKAGKQVISFSIYKRQEQNKFKSQDTN